MFAFAYDHAILIIAFLASLITFAESVADVFSKDSKILRSIEKSNEFRKKHPSIFDTDVEWEGVLFRFIFGPVLLIGSSTYLLGALIQRNGIVVSELTQIGMVALFVCAVGFVVRMCAEARLGHPTRRRQVY